MMFTLDSTYRMSQTFIIQQNIFSFTTTVLTAFLFTLLLFYAHYYHPPKKEYIFGFNPTNYLLEIPAVLSFILSTINLFE